MTTRVEFFAALREAAGAPEREFALADGATVADLLAAVRAAHPAVNLAEVVVMAGLDYVETTHVIHPGEVISLLPPGAAR